MYWALVPSACMAGGRFEAIWSSSNIKAAFSMGLNLILSWKPFYYEAHLYIGFSVRVKLSIKILFKRIRKTFRFCIGASLRIWGPDFAGYAKINLKIVSFKIRFGNQSRPSPPPLTWSEFKASFLPDSKSICTFNVQKGLIKTTADKIDVVNPDTMELRMNTAIPASRTNIELENAPTSFGIGSMGLKDVDSNLKLTILRDREEVSRYFEINPTYKTMPEALWGKADRTGVLKKPSLNGGLIQNMLAGFQIIPKSVVNPANTEKKDIIHFSYDVETREDVFQWQQPMVSKISEHSVIDTILKAADTRNRVLSEMGFGSSDFSFTELMGDAGYEEAFVTEPKSIERSF